MIKLLLNIFNFPWN